MYEENVDLLSATALFEPLSREEVERIAPGIPVKDFRRGRHVYTPAYAGGMFFLLLRGTVRVYRTEKAHDITLSLVRAGEIFGEAAFSSRERKCQFAQALKPSRVALLNSGLFERLLSRYPRVGLKAMELLSDRLSFYEDRISDAGLKEVPSRLASVILEITLSEGLVTGDGYKIPTHYSHEQLSSMIGAKRVAVTRALTRLRKAGVVEVYRRRIHVKDLEALKRAAS